MLASFELGLVLTLGLRDDRDLLFSVALGEELRSTVAGFLMGEVEISVFKRFSLALPTLEGGVGGSPLAEPPGLSFF